MEAYRDISDTNIFNGGDTYPRAGQEMAYSERGGRLFLRFKGLCGGSHSRDRDDTYFTGGLREAHRRRAQYGSVEGFSVRWICRNGVRDTDVDYRCHCVWIFL